MLNSSKILNAIRQISDKKAQEVFDYILYTYIPETNRTVIEEVVSLLERFDYMLIGGWAVSFYSEGKRKPTEDDIDIRVRAEDIKRLEKVFTERGFRVCRHAFDPASRSKWLMLEKEGQKVDVGYAEKPWEIEALSDKVHVFYHGRLGISLKVSSPEYMIVSKLHAGRDKDFFDLLFLIKSPYMQVDRAKALVKKHLTSLDLEDFKSMLLYAGGLSEEEVRRLYNI